MNDHFKSRSGILFFKEYFLSFLSVSTLDSPGIIGDEDEIVILFLW